MKSKIFWLLFVLPFIECCTFKFSNNLGEFSNQEGYYESIIFNKNKSYSFTFAASMIKGNGNGNWSVKNDTLILNSEYQKKSIKLYLYDKINTNNSLSCIVLVKRWSNGKYYFDNNLKVVLNDSIKIFSGESVLKNRRSNSLKVLTRNGYESTKLYTKLNSDTLIFHFDAPNGDEKYYPFFNNDKCLIRNDSLFFFNNPERRVLIRRSMQ